MSGEESRGADSAALEERLRQIVEHGGGPAGATVEHHPVLTSTNDRCRWLGAHGALEWSLVVAARQTAGRGRRGRSWLSPPGNLYLSVLLRPGFSDRLVALLPLLGGLAVQEALASAGVDARVKWPNDLLVRGRKLAGLLAEVGSDGPGGSYVVLGCGVNVAEPPGSLGEAVTSVLEQTSQAPDLLELAGRILARLRVWYDSLARDGGSAILDEWYRKSVPWWGEEVEVRSAGSTLRGTAVGLDERGGLRLRRADGGMVTVFSGEARELRRPSRSRGRL
jgi:BirA family biotin operon repressor/biotin-[acetyl-CoA-carboxylase] ligase